MESRYLKDVMNKFGTIDPSDKTLAIGDAQNSNFVPRSSYTNQIMDILKNVARQREETAKV